MAAVSWRSVPDGDWNALNNVLRSLAMNLNAAQGFGVPVPANATAEGTPGTFAWDGKYLYMCVATNSWQRFGPGTSF